MDLDMFAEELLAAFRSLRPGASRKLTRRLATSVQTIFPGANTCRVLLTVGPTAYTVTVATRSTAVGGGQAPLLETCPRSEAAVDAEDAAAAGSELRADVGNLSQADGCAPRCHSHSSSDSDRSLDRGRQTSRLGVNIDPVVAQLKLSLSPSSGPSQTEAATFETLAACVSARLPAVVTRLKRRQVRAGGAATMQRRSLGDKVLGALLRRSATAPASKPSGSSSALHDCCRSDSGESARSASSSAVLSRQASERSGPGQQAVTPASAGSAGSAVTTTPNLSGPLGAVGSSLRLGPLHSSPDLMSLEQWVSSQTGTPDRSSADPQAWGAAESAELDSQEALWGSPVTLVSALRLCSSAPSLLLPAAPPRRAGAALRAQSGPNPFEDLPGGFSARDGAAGGGWLPNPFEVANGLAGSPARPSHEGGDASAEGRAMQRASSLPTLLACERWQEDVTARRSDSASRLWRAAGAPVGSTRRHSVGKSASAEALAFRLMATLPEDKPALLPADAAHGSHLHMTFNPVKPDVLMTPFPAGPGSGRSAAQQLARVTRCPSAPASPVKKAKAMRAPLRLQRASKSAPHTFSAASGLGAAMPAPWLLDAQI